jgi:hypothetical protein
MNKENTIKVNVRFEKTMRYSQEIEVTEEEFEKLKEFDGKDLWELKQPELYSLVDMNIDYSDVFDSDEDLVNFEIEKVESGLALDQLTLNK